MNICFLTEGKWDGTVGRAHPNMRTDLSWICALEAEHHHLYANVSGFDLVMIIVPKNCEDGHFDISIWYDHYLKNIKPNNRQVAVVQEGPHDYYQDYRIDTQIQYLELLNDVNIIYCHNEYDRRYYRGIISDPKIDIRILPTVMIDDAVNPSLLTNPDHRSGTMIGGTFCQWYSGIDSFMVAGTIGEPVYAPEMGRIKNEERNISDINWLTYSTWQHWMTELSKRKYAVHMMRTYAAGSFSLNCAWLSIPCIGYNSIDTQRLCFPELSVNQGDLEQAQKIAHHLRSNQLFYNHIASYAKKMAKDIYGEGQFKKSFYEPFNL